jgi:phenylacetic acid degradation protein PaaD
MHEHLDIARQRFAHDNYARSLGIVLDDLTHDSIRMHMQLRDDMLNWFSRVHGGAIYALADAAFSLLGNNSNNLAVALDCSITYHTSPEQGSLLVVEGEKLSASRRTGSYLFKVYMDQHGIKTIVATMKSIAYRTGMPIDHTVGQ